MIKPDAVKRNLVSKIIEKFEQRGYKLIAMKLIRPNTELLTAHYDNISTMKFFPHLIEYMKGGPVIPMIWEGRDVVNQGRRMIGSTDPLLADQGTLRGDFSVNVGRNIIHGSDSIENAEKEIKLWFNDDEIITWDDPLCDVIYEPFEP